MRADLNKMATPVLFTFSLCLVLCALVSSKPVAQESEQVQLTSADSVLKRTWNLDTVRKVESARDSEQVLILGSAVEPSSRNTNESLKRDKRATIQGNGCSGEMIWFMSRCMTFEAYERILEDVEGDK